MSAGDSAEAPKSMSREEPGCGLSAMLHFWPFHVSIRARSA
jgi:hypothetical protein